MEGMVVYVCVVCGFLSFPDSSVLLNPTAFLASRLFVGFRLLTNRRDEWKSRRPPKGDSRKNIFQNPVTFCQRRAFMCR